MSFAELLEELRTLSPAELEKIQHVVDQLQSEAIEETPEMLAAIEEGLKSLREEGSVPIEQVIAEMKSWNTASK